MIDLKKLEAKFEALFEVETEHSFHEWLDNKFQREFMTLLGTGAIEVINLELPEIQTVESYKPVSVCVNNNVPKNTAGNAQFAMAA